MTTSAPASRDQMLARVSAALRGRAKAAHPGRLETPTPSAATGPSVAAGQGLARADAGRRQGLEAAFAKQFAANGGESVTPDPHRPRNEWLADFIVGAEGGPDDRPAAPTAALAQDVPAELRPNLPVAPPAQADVGVVLAWGAVAETGTLLLTPDGGRAVQLLPPTLVAWVPADRLFAKLGDALLELPERLPAVVGLHSGPSKSADIGRTVVTGVHGPGRCIAVLEGERRGADLRRSA